MSTDSRAVFLLLDVSAAEQAYSTFYLPMPCYQLPLLTNRRLLRMVAQPRPLFRIPKVRLLFGCFPFNAIMHVSQIKKATWRIYEVLTNEIAQKHLNFFLSKLFSKVIKIFGALQVCTATGYCFQIYATPIHYSLPCYNLSRKKAVDLNIN